MRTQPQTKKMKTIVITGGIGAGKSSLITLLKKKDWPVFISDQAVDKLLKPDNPCYTKLKKLFPEKNFYHAGGFFNKKKLAEVLFQDQKTKDKVEKLLHPLVRQAFQNFVEKQKKQAFTKVFCEIPLISTDFLKSFDHSILLSCPLNIRKQRLIKAGWNISDIEKRLSFQISDSKVKNQVDFIIDNSGTIQNLEEQLLRIFNHLKSC